MKTRFNKIVEILRAKIGIRALDMLLKEKTKERFGYEPQELTDSSQKPVLAQCDDCGKESEYTSDYYRNFKENKKDICSKCAHKHRKQVVVVDVDKDSSLPLPPETLHQETEAKFGYKPEKLSPWSRKKVLVRCSVLGSIHEVARCALNRSQSIKESGHYISVGGHTKARRTGVVVSDTTRKKMRDSQMKRRKLESVRLTNNPNQGE